MRQRSHQKVPPVASLTTSFLGYFQASVGGGSCMANSPIKQWFLSKGDEK
jgi:hypothetical protein